MVRGKSNLSVNIFFPVPKYPQTSQIQMTRMTYAFYRNTKKLSQCPHTYPFRDTDDSGNILITKQLYLCQSHILSFLSLPSSRRCQTEQRLTKKKVK